MDEKDLSIDFINMVFNRYLVEIFNSNKNIKATSLDELTEYISKKFYDYNIEFTEDARKHIKKIFIDELNNQE